MKERLLTAVCVLGLTALVATFFWPTLRGGASLVPTDILHELMRPYCVRVTLPQAQNHYASDALVEDYPWAVFWQQTVRNGQFPLWNPYILGGHLHAALSMPALFSPFKLLLLLGSAERVLSLTFVLQFLIAALSMFAFLRAIGRSRLAAFLGATIWTLNSGLLMWYWRSPAIFCFAPLVLLLLERGTWFGAFAAGGVLGVAFLSGNIQAGAHLALLCVVYAVAVAWRRESRAFLARTALALLLGGCMAAVHWLPTLEALPRDVYAATNARGPDAGLRHTLLGLPMLVTFVFPALTGSTETFDLLKLIGASRADFTGYIGVAPFALAVAAALAGGGRHTRAWLGIIAVVLALVFFTPLVKCLYHRVFIVAVFALSALAAEGVDLMLSATEQQREVVRRTMRVMASLCGAMLVAVAATQVVVAWKRPAISAAAKHYVLARAEGGPFGFMREWFAERAERFLDWYRVSNPQFWVPAFCGMAVALAWRLQHRHRLRAVVLAAAVADVWTVGRPLVPQSDLRRYPLTVSHPVLTPLERDAELFRVYRGGTNSFFLFRPNLLMLAGVHDLSGSFSLSPPTVESLPSIRADGAPNRLLDMQNVKYIVRPTSEPALPPGRFELLVEADETRLYRNRDCLPRAWWVPRAEVMTNRVEMLQRMTREEFDPRAVVLLEEPPAEPSSDAGSAGTAKVIVTHYTPLRVTVRVQSDADGWLVLADTWDNGWSARVDGKTAKLYRANWVLRSVWVPRGTHEVEFEFSPWTVRVGGLISLGAVVVTVLSGLATAARSRQQRRPSASNPPATDSVNTNR